MKFQLRPRTAQQDDQQRQSLERKLGDAKRWMREHNVVDIGEHKEERLPEKEKPE